MAPEEVFDKVIKDLRSRIREVKFSKDDLQKFSDAMDTVDSLLIKFNREIFTAKINLKKKYDFAQTKKSKSAKSKSRSKRQKAKKETNPPAILSQPSDSVQKDHTSTQSNSDKSD